jgi:hypothetical protein
MRAELCLWQLFAFFSLLIRLTLMQKVPLPVRPLWPFIWCSCSGDKLLVSVL